MEETKKPWQSKTTWAALVIAVTAFFPSAAAWIAEHPTEYGLAIGFIFTALRFITKDKISIT